jgi:hypothetical protein
MAVSTVQDWAIDTYQLGHALLPNFQTVPYQPYWHFLAAMTAGQPEVVVSNMSEHQDHYRRTKKMVTSFEYLFSRNTLSR